MNEALKIISDYGLVFAVGGLVCALAQVLIIKTKLTPARILVIFLIIGIVLEGVGVYESIKSVAKTGISVPIIGFGAMLAKGSIKYASENGILGAIAGGIIHSAYGVGAAIIMSYFVTLIFSPKSK